MKTTKTFSPYAASFYLRRFDGKETFVSSHQPASRKGGKRYTASELVTISKSILEMPHWQQFLAGKPGIIIVVNAFNDSERQEIVIQ